MGITFKKQNKKNFLYLLL